MRFDSDEFLNIALFFFTPISRFFYPFSLLTLTFQNVKEWSFRVRAKFYGFMVKFYDITMNGVVGKLLTQANK